jgi:hypothetical protein
MVEGRNNLLNKILPKVIPTTAMTLGLVGNTNIANTDLLLHSEVSSTYISI